MGFVPTSESCLGRSCVSVMRMACVVKVEEEDGSLHCRSGVRGMAAKVRVESGGWIRARTHRMLLEPRDRRRVLMDRLIMKRALLVIL